MRSSLRPGDPVGKEQAEEAAEQRRLRPRLSSLMGSPFWLLCSSSCWLVHKHFLSSCRAHQEEGQMPRCGIPPPLPPPRPAPECPRQVAQVPASSPALGVSLWSITSPLKFCWNAPRHPACPLTLVCAGTMRPRPPGLRPEMPSAVPFAAPISSSRGRTTHCWGAQRPTQCHEGCRPSLNVG